MAARRGLAITALALGIVGLFTGGVLIVGSLVGVVLAAVALERTPPRDRDVAWAAVAANVFALLTVLPLSGAVFAYRATVGPLPLVDPQPLPELAPPPGGTGALDLPVPPPPPPPPPPTHPATGPPRTSQTADEAGLSKPSSSAPVAARPGAGEGEAPVPIRISGEIEPPRKTHHVNPVYPQAAKRERVEGIVVLECTISPQGKVVAVKVLRSVPLLDQAAIDAVEQWEYTPTLLDGVAVPVIMTVTLNFKLS